MELELETTEKGVVTFYSFEYILPSKVKRGNDEHCEVNSGGKTFIVKERYSVLKNMVRESNLREISIGSNL